MRTLLRTLAAAAAIGFLPGAAAAPSEAPAALEARVEDLLGRLTLAEKLSLLGGDQDFYIRAVPRLGLPAVKMADGPLGVRNYGLSTAYPATVGLAASWDTDLARAFGGSMARDARARGVGIMLAPAVNIMRVPRNGRNFEYLSEDPFLAGAFAVQIVSGMQERGVVATVKHFAANNQETERDTIDVRVGPRALREIYLPAFRAAVENGHAWAVMSAYNRLNGEYCSANSWLNNTVLKGDWGFKGVLMSDWGAAHDTLGVVNGGLDLEMPSGAYMNAGAIQPLLDSGKVSMATVDDKVRRILRLEVANGFLDRPQAESTPRDDPQSDAVALRIAREAAVLLKNDHGALPLNPKRVHRIVVLGPNAQGFPCGGGSGHVEPFHYVSLLDGLRRAAGPKVHVDVIAGPDGALLDALVGSARYDGPLTLEWSSGDGKERRVLARSEESKVDVDGRRGLPAAADPAGCSASWKGALRVPASGPYVLLVRNHGNVDVHLDGRQVIGSWSNPGDTLVAQVSLEAGRSYPLEVYTRYDGLGSAAVRFAWGAAPPILTDEDARKVRSADAVVVCAGYNLSLEGEGADRAYALPEGQPELIRRVAALNPRTVVVLNSGGVVETADWIDSVPALLQAWYPGQEGGRALGEILTGAVNPSGKLPITYERRAEDSPSFGHYPGSKGAVDYAEGILVGYRWFDAKGVRPLFPFGHGLSYTTFHYGKLDVEPLGDGRVQVKFEVTNNGTMDGSEVAEVYVSPPVPSQVQRPVRELKGFGRVWLPTDQTATASIILDRSAFQYYDASASAWVTEPGKYTIAVGPSSRSLLLTGSVSLP